MVCKRLLNVKILLFVFCLFSYSAKSLDKQNSMYEAMMYGVATGVGVTGATSLIFSCMQEEGITSFVLPPLCGATAGLIVWRVLQEYYDFLSKHKEDLTKKRIELEKLIQELEESLSSEEVVDDLGDKKEKACNSLEFLLKEEEDSFARMLLASIQKRLEALGEKE